MVDLSTFAKIVDTTNDERKPVQKRMTQGLARILRVIITAEHPKTQMPKRTKPQFPESPNETKIGETAANHPTNKNIGSRLTSTQEAAHVFTKLKFEADAVVPPRTPCPAPKLIESPRTPNGADVKMAVEAAEAKQKVLGVKESYPLIPQLVLARLRVVIVGEVAGVSDRFGCLGAQLTNLAEGMEVALKTNEETAAKLAHAQNQGWQQLVRDRRDINRIETQLEQPNQMIISRAIEYQGRVFQFRSEKREKGRTSPIKMEKQKKGGASRSWKCHGNRS